MGLINNIKSGINNIRNKALDKTYDFAVKKRNKFLREIAKNSINDLGTGKLRTGNDSTTGKKFVLAKLANVATKKLAQNRLERYNRTGALNEYDRITKELVPDRDNPGLNISIGGFRMPGRISNKQHLTPEKRSQLRAQRLKILENNPEIGYIRENPEHKAQFELNNFREREQFAQTNPYQNKKEWEKIKDEVVKNLKDNNVPIITDKEAYGDILCTPSFIKHNLEGGLTTSVRAANNKDIRDGKDHRGIERVAYIGSSNNPYLIAHEGAPDISGHAKDVLLRESGLAEEIRANRNTSSYIRNKDLHRNTKEQMLDDAETFDRNQRRFGYNENIKPYEKGQRGVHRVTRFLEQHPDIPEEQKQKMIENHKLIEEYMKNKPKVKFFSSPEEVKGGIKNYIKALSPISNSYHKSKYEKEAQKLIDELNLNLNPVQAEKVKTEYVNARAKGRNIGAAISIVMTLITSAMYHIGAKGLRESGYEAPFTSKTGEAIFHTANAAQGLILKPWSNSQAAVGGILGKKKYITKLAEKIKEETQNENN